MDETVTTGWGDFAVAMVGAAAALAGLVMVAISVNIREILALPGLTARAAAAVGSLVLVVVTGGLLLVPGQPGAVLGVEVLVAVAPAVVLHTISLRHRARNSASGRFSLALYLPLAALQLLPFALGAVLLIVTSTSTGIYLVAAGVILTVIGSMIDAWVLMVEILR
ncbi:MULTISPECIES: hypothetical protein [Cryobacterium]|uniref:hypothetical protein n=1 Tax=Cryobacterium TaxID=69578 RepID=UPI000CD42E4B|nr:MULTISPECIES: hypothetical protein [Cryobacterium]POH68094.1 hypothetical protein C3B60_07925 [Cryobacterium zongtaii]TFC48093.1 hypothetical protein E3O57_04120 [Cryobacterium sp. TMN-39-2]